MEKRAILAAVLMAALLVVYQTFFLGQGEAAPEVPDRAAGARPSHAPGPRPPAPPPRAEEKPQTGAGRRAARPAQKLARVESPRYIAVVSSEGGKLQEFNLRYRGDKPMVIVGSLGPTGLTVDAGGGREVVPLELPDTTVCSAPSGRRPTSCCPEKIGGSGFAQTHRFDAEGYTINTFIRVENPGASPRQVVISLPWVTRASWQGEAEKFPGQHPTEIVWQTNGHIERIENLAAVGQHAAETASGSASAASGTSRRSSRRRRDSSWRRPPSPRRRTTSSRRPRP